MFYRWLHKSWKYFWGIILTFLAVILIAGAAILGALQLDVTQNYLAGRIEQSVSKNINAKLSIGEVSGFLPFHANIHDVVLQRADSSRADTIATIKNLQTQINLWSLLQNKITITGFSINKPHLWLSANKNGRIDVLKRKTNLKNRADSTSAKSSWITRVEVIAPQIAITNGKVSFDSLAVEDPAVKLPRSFTVSNINANFFLEWSKTQRYFDIESLSADVNKLKMKNFSMSGQVFSDKRYLEFNSFYLSVGHTQFVLNGEIDGLNLTQKNLSEQFLAARYNLDIKSGQIYPQEFKDVFTSVPDVKGPLNLNINMQGTTDSLQVERASLGTGKSIVSLNGLFQHLQDRSRLSYRFRLDTVNVRRKDLLQFVDTLSSPQYQAFEKLAVAGSAHGTVDSVDVDLKLSSPLGNVQVQGKSQLKRPYKYVGTLSGKKINLAGYLPSKLDTTSINFDARLDGFGLTLDDAVNNFRADFYNSQINDLKIDTLQLSSTLVNGFWKQEYKYQSRNAKINGSGWVDFSREEPALSLQGNAHNINIAKFTGDSAIAQTQLNFDYNVHLQSLNPDRMQGRANLDVKPSVIGKDTVGAHQIYMDLSAPGQERRTFRLTSSFIDMNVTGTILPGSIVDEVKYWAFYLKTHFKKELLLAEAPSKSKRPKLPDKNISLDGSVKFKDLELIKSYLPDFPGIYTDSKIIFNVNAGKKRMLVSAKMRADSLYYGQYELHNINSTFTANFRSDRSLKEFSDVDFQTTVDSLQSEKVDLDSVNIALSLKNDSLFFSPQIARISDNARFHLKLNSSLSDTSINVKVNDFYLGDNQYAWQNTGTPTFTYLGNQKVQFGDFKFQNEDERFKLRGVFSQDRKDSLTYDIKDISLGRISDLVKGNLNFSGILNGSLTTRSLTKQPSIQGGLKVDSLRLNDRMVGDVTFKSKFNPQKDRFDTHIGVLTNSTKYKKYLNKNDQIGQNFSLDGYFVTPKPNAQQDSLFYFKTDFKQIDMWVIPLVIGNVFSEMEGQASGSGYISGSLNNIDFHADFDTKNVFAKPNFIETNYFLNGHVILDRNKGVLFDDVNVLDTKGGKGTLSGSIDLNDFKPLTFFDLTLNMQNLQFLNNNLEPGVPFYGNISGTGEVRLTGSNSHLIMRTANPVKITSSSELFLPLLEETQLNQSDKFIRFVDSFDEKAEKTSLVKTKSGEEKDLKQIEESKLRAAIQNLSFSERFDLDLQFDASNGVNVKLVFDPVTGEVLSADGTGQLRITMQDQDLQIFGQYTIETGRYQFVTGEIVSRKFELQPGGTIVWEGPPDNARLDISAKYQARPYIAPLTTGAAINSQSQNRGQRVPINLILQITGTLQSVENNYYFELPRSYDITSSNTTLSYTLNEINRNEEEKFLQATSILISGQFVPTQGAGSGTANIGQSLGRGANVINPLLSNQVISPLLSNQINALINSDVSRFDVDFNLNTYNEVDLGLALRLYNDKLVLRREGRLTGGSSQSTLGDRIGDLNATYRIRRGLSLTAFHRQDQILSSLGATSSRAGDVTPNVDGLGIEADVQFNRWKKFPKKFWGIFSGTNKGGNVRTTKDLNKDQGIDSENNKKINEQQ